jgi:DNA-binding helix-hairpin-helix protein with protein kinase domain
MLDTVRTLNVSGTFMKASVTGEMEDLMKRLRDGDATVGWLGDDTLELVAVVPVDPVTKRPVAAGQQMFEVWGHDVEGKQYVCLRWPRADASLLRRLAEIDPRTSDFMRTILAAEEKRQRDLEQKVADIREEAGDRAHFAILRDIGHMEGQTKRLYPVSDLKKD